MTQEDKDLLLKDLCARLPYGVKVDVINEDNEHHIVKISEGNIGHLGKGFWKECKPYLFPLSSMTDEQIMNAPDSIHVSDLEDLRYDSVWTKLDKRFPDLIDLIDWLNENHFDYRGLIPMDLAIDATGKNIY